jgi:hypothetical protein
VSVVIVALAAIPAYVLVDTLSSQAPATVEYAHPTAVHSSRALADDCPGPRGITVFLVLDKLDVTNGSLAMQVSACAGSDVTPLLAKDQLASLSIPGLQSPFSHRLSDLSFDATPLGSVTVPADGDPARYPLDTYAGNIDPAITAVSLAMLSSRVSLSVVMRTDPGVSGFEWSSASQAATEGAPTSIYTNPAPVGLIDKPISLEGRRAVTTRLFVLCLVGVPLVLIALMVVALVGTPPRSAATLVGVVAIMLAILPIRSVLVPSEISSLTLVDFALALEMAALAAGAALRYLWPWHPADPRPNAPANAS